MIGVIVIIVIVAIILLTASVMFSVNYSSPINNCNPGECPTNLVTGVKRCSSDPTESMSFNPKYEVCNSENLCDNSITPFAQTPNGSTIDSGVCIEERCNCMTHKMCSNWNSVAFKDEGLTMSQIPLSGTRILQPGYSCDMHISTINKINCPVDIDTLTGTNIGVDYCSAMYPECGDIPLCESGFLAIIENGLSSRYTCVASTPCTCGQSSYLNDVTGEITCKILT